MKKTLSLILALLMSASCAATIFADEAVVTSIEEEAPVEEVVEEASEYDLAVKFLEYKKIMQGKGDGLLHVEDAVKRYEMAIFAGRIATGWVTNDEWMNGTDDKTGFTDLEGSGAIDALGVLSYVAEKDIVKGYPDGTFKPEATVTYRDALAIVVRTLGYTGLEYPWGIIEKAVTLGLTEDITGVAYTDTINRGVAAQIMYNALFNATTAKGTKLAMDSFDVEYGWENILVVANDVASYEINGKTTADGKGLVSFKLVEDDGELADVVYYVNADLDGDKVADLEFGKFYNALFEIDEDEFVDMIGAIEYEATVLKNNDEVAEIADFMKNYTIVDKYNVKNLTKTTLYNDEIIVVEDSSETIAIEWNKAASYAINWETGDILKYDAATKKYTTEWHYNEMYDLYFKWDDKAIIDNGTELEIAGIQIMSDKDLADLKAAITASTVSKTATYDGYKLYTGAFDSAYAQLVAYDFDGDDMYDYAKYNTYKFGTYSGVKAIDGKKGNGYFFDNVPYAIAGSGDDYKAGNDDTYTVTGLTEGYTGYVIYDVDATANTIEVVKEIPELGKNADEDSYYTYGIVRGVDAANSTVIIGNEPIRFDYDKLVGTEYTSANKKTIANTFFNSMFNQFVKYVLVDGKLVHLELAGQGGNNYIVVEDFYGIDSDGYIVVAGYTTNDLAYKTFRIGAYDGWKTGSGFFYNEKELEDMFVKGTVYKITSTDNTEKNGNVYYVTSLGVLNAQGDGITGTAAANENVKVTFEDNYRTITFADGKTETKKMKTSDKYVIVANADYMVGDYMPIYCYQGIVEDNGAATWTIEGDMLVKGDGTYVFVNAFCTGFHVDTVKTGFIAFPGAVNYLNVDFDGYNSEYYVYGATTYTVEGFNLLTGEKEKTAAGLNIDIDANKIYATVDGRIINDDAALTWAGFWTAVKAAYADVDATTADYLFAEYDVAPSITKADLSKKISKDLLGLKSEHDDIIDGYTTKQITLVAGHLTKVEDYKNNVAATVETIKAYVIFRTSDSKALVYFDKANANTKSTGSDTKDIAKKIEVTTDHTPAYETVIDGTITVDTVTKNGKVEKATVKALTLTWGADGKDATDDTLRSILENGFHFGRKGDTLNEDWETLVDGKRVYGSIVAGTYPIKDKFDSELANDVLDVVAKAVKAVTIEGLEVVVEAGKAPVEVEISFVDNFGLTNVEWNFVVEVAIENGAVVAEFVSATATNSLNLIVK